MDLQLERFSHIHFDELTHTYTIDGKKIPGVSSTIARYKPEFNREYWLTRKAEELGVTEEELSQTWDYLRDSACEKGKYTHSFIETSLLREAWDKPPVEVVQRYLDSCTDESLACEVVMGNALLCGTTDNIALRNGELIIKDWKTNKRFRRDSPYYFKAPFDYIPNCEFWIYAIQLNLYRVLLDLPVSKLEVVWFHEHGWEEIELPIMHREMRIIFEDLNRLQ